MGLVLRILVAISCIIALPAWADWVKLDGAEINAALSEKSLIYPNATQTFYASGRTLYNAGRDSWGYWAARGDQYCSQWPPGDLWSCYDLETDGDKLRFVAEDGSATIGQYAK